MLCIFIAPYPVPVAISGNVQVIRRPKLNPSDPLVLFIEVGTIIRPLQSLRSPPFFPFSHRHSLRLQSLKENLSLVPVKWTGGPRGHMYAFDLLDSCRQEVALSSTNTQIDIHKRVCPLTQQIVQFKSGFT